MLCAPEDAGRIPASSLKNTEPSRSMAQASERRLQSTLACKCLNIQLDQVKPPAGKQSPSLKENGFSWVYVGETGIRVVRSSLLA